jgi:hypothetical protein
MRNGRIEIADAVMIDVALGVTESAGESEAGPLYEITRDRRTRHESNAGAPAWHLAEIDEINTTKLDARKWNTCGDPAKLKGRRDRSRRLSPPCHRR